MARKRKRPRDARKLDEDVRTHKRNTANGLETVGNSAIFMIDTEGEPASKVLKTKPIKYSLKKDVAKTKGSEAEAKKVKKMVANLAKNSTQVRAKKGKPTVHDVWSAVEAKERAYEALDPFVKPTKAPVKMSRRVRNVRRKAALEGESKEKLKKMNLVAGSGSYNPSLEDYEAGLQRTVDNHLAAAKKRAAIGQSKVKVLRKSSEEELEAEKEENESMFDDESVISSLYKNQGARKTTAQRNREARHKKALKEAEKQKKEKLMLKAIDRAGAIDKELRKEKAKQERQRKDLKKLKERTKHEKELVGKVRGREVERQVKLDVLMPHDLPDTMREMKVLGNAVRDQFDVLHAKNLVDTGNKSLRNSRRTARAKVKEMKDTHPRKRY